jgi:hypothetical protein
MHGSVHQRIENAIAAIDSFLDATEQTFSSAMASAFGASPLGFNRHGPLAVAAITHQPTRISNRCMLATSNP